MTGERCVVAYGGQEIVFSLRHADRSTLEIAVDPDGSVHVVAPLGVVRDDVCARVARRARWVLAQQAYFAQFDPRTPARRFVSGETHLYLGRQYRLKVVAGDGGSVRLTGGRFLVVTRSPSDPEQVQELLQGWYRQKAAERLTERLHACWERFGRDDLEMPQMRIRTMRTRWGSMSPTGVLSLNVDLVRAPRDCIDYVILHELCHLEHSDHGSGFRARLDQVMPDWEKRKHRLELALA